MTQSLMLFKRFVAVALIILSSHALFADEVITSFDEEKSLPVLNEELRKINKALSDMQHAVKLRATTVSELPAAVDNLGSVRLVSNAASVSDCTVGGGSTYHLCVSNGTAWVQA